MLQVKCPHCPSVANVSESLVGKTVQCGSCHKSFSIESVVAEESIESDSPATEISADTSENGMERAAKNPDGSALQRFFSDPETKGIAFFATISISLVVLVVLWLLFGYVVPLATLAAVGITFGLFTLIKKPSAASALKFCPSCGTKWTPSENACQRCSWDYRTRQYADPVKRITAKQAKSTVAPFSSPTNPTATQPATDPYEIREELKACPNCGEKILQVARVCKHCRSDLSGGSNMPPKALSETLLPKVRRNEYSPTDEYSWSDYFSSDFDRLISSAVIRKEHKTGVLMWTFFCALSAIVIVALIWTADDRYGSLTSSSLVKFVLSFVAVTVVAIICIVVARFMRLRAETTIVRFKIHDLLREIRSEAFKR